MTYYYILKNIIYYIKFDSKVHIVLNYIVLKYIMLN